jgi:hypothetical protein
MLTVEEEISRVSTQYSKRPSTYPQRTHSKSSRTSKKKAIAATPANRSAHQIQCVIVVVVNLVTEVWFVSNNPYVTKVPAPTWYRGVLMSTLLHVSILWSTVLFYFLSFLFSFLHNIC